MSIDALRKDYTEMGVMIFGTPPPFEEILSGIKELEMELNFTLLQRAWNGITTAAQVGAPEWPQVGFAIEGDFSGIQRFVFRPVPGAGGAARRLRARSFRVLALTRLVAHSVEQAFSDADARLFYSAGGRFLVVMRTCSDSQVRLTALQNAIDDDLLREYRGELAFHLVGAEFADGRVPRSALGAALGRRKLNPLAGALQMAAGWISDRFIFTSSSGGRCDGCAITEQVRMVGEEQLCDSCVADRDLGGRLLGNGPRSLVEAPGGPLHLLGKHWAVSGTGSPEISSIGHAPTHNGQLATFEDLAAKATGRPYLGYLRIDADRIGAAFGKLEDNPLRVWGLSRLLDSSFSAVVDDMLSTRFPNVYPVYGGGDDLFTVGPWHDVLEFASALRQEFRTISGDKLTFSAGVALAKKKQHILTKADEAEHALNMYAKGIEVAPVAVTQLPPNERIRVENMATPAPGADAFRWFFLASNPPWNSTRHSLSNVRSLQKEFPLKLRNVYSFFTIYANIDGFDPKEHAGRPAERRALLDRWILSELSRLVASMTELMDSYASYEAARELSEFVEGLSNWWLRRSRDRFWSAAMDESKLDAYATLYECLTTVIKLAAPFTPFQTEELYQNLVARQFGAEAPESVHLCDYPSADRSRIDHDLLEDMALVRDIVSLGLRVRNDHKLKVRQPLSEASVVVASEPLRKRVADYADLIADELNVREVRFAESADEFVHYKAKPNFRRVGARVGKRMPAVKKALEAADAAALRREILSSGEARLAVDGEVIAFDSEDVEIQIEAREGFAAAGDSTAVVILRTELTQDLLDEGLYRDVLNRVQTLRKELELEYTERIGLTVRGSSRVERVIEDRRGHFMAETLCAELTTGAPGADGAGGDSSVREYDLDGETLRVTLLRG